MKILNESLNSIKEIILFKAKNYFSLKFQKKSNEVSEYGYKMSFINKIMENIEFYSLNREKDLKNINEDIVKIKNHILES